MYAGNFLPHSSMGQFGHLIVSRDHHRLHSPIAEEKPDLLDRLIQVIGETLFLTKQDLVPWYKPFYS